MRRSGALIFWNPTKGYGFVNTPAVPSGQLFVHARDLLFDEREMHEGIQLSFEVGGRRGGKHLAVNVTRLV